MCAVVGVVVGTGNRAKNHLYLLKHRPVSLIGNGYFREKIRRLAIRMLNQSGGGVEIKTA